MHSRQYQISSNSPSRIMSYKAMIKFMRIVFQNTRNMTMNHSWRVAFKEVNRQEPIKRHIGESHVLSRKNHLMLCNSIIIYLLKATHNSKFERLNVEFSAFYYRKSRNNENSPKILYSEFLVCNVPADDIELIWTVHRHASERKRLSVDIFQKCSIKYLGSHNHMFYTTPRQVSQKIQLLLCYCKYTNLSCERYGRS